MSENLSNGKSISELIEESLLYERVFSRMNGIIERLSSERSAHLREMRESGEKPDKSYELLLKILSRVRTSVRGKSENLWAEVDATAVKHDSGYEALANAILELAALDYESTLCGEGNASEKRLIEMFAKYDADAFTKIDFTKVLNRIEKEHRNFVKLVRERGDEIISETWRIRRANGNMRNTRVKCPLCGSGLYAFNKAVNGWQMIRCTGCNFSQNYKVKSNAV